ncbi:hypothetical protein [Fodinicola feengrottensis]|uniref:hypothetical protein n=1 Tax=Fodinicola feengrottensis TaxID=435914 RepID=UPI0013CF9343|nr:hypothetical protein [Fodinicola feengrottensis]
MSWLAVAIGHGRESRRSAKVQESYSSRRGQAFVRTLSRVAPALLLLVLSPLVAEFLLGDFPITKVAFLLFVLPMYGCGAILIREIVRRTGRGWPTMLVLALAYAVLEEGITTMSLFNPNYAGDHLLAYGLIPAVGMSPVWTISTCSACTWCGASERRSRWSRRSPALDGRPRGWGEDRVLGGGRVLRGRRGRDDGVLALPVSVRRLAAAARRVWWSCWSR